jgi:uncharacterized cupin superfamily protein
MATYTEPHAETEISSAELTSWPLPAEWVRSGDPAPAGAVLSRSDDSRIIRGVWQCTPGTFKWIFSYDETLVVVEGRASVELDTGDTIELEPGVLAFFGRGHEATWTVHETLRKAFHADSPEPLPF